MAKWYSGEDFLIHVGTTIERQLQEWDSRYAVNIMKSMNYVFVVKLDDTYYEMTLTEEEVETLKEISSNTLDQKIWKSLQVEGLVIHERGGNYMGFVL